MSKTLKAIVATAAITGLMAGTQASAIVVQKAAGKQVSSDSSKVEKLACNGKHDCKGQNSCKGKGNCKTGDNGCKGKNSCKGKGGCATSGQ